MRRVTVLCVMMFLALLGRGLAGNVYAQLSKVTITSPTGTSILSPGSEEYTTGESMTIVWKDEHLVSGQDAWVRWASPTKNYYNKKKFRVDAYYKVKVSFDEITWIEIAGHITPSGLDENGNQVSECEWKVPVVEQSKRCWIKVIAFDANGEKNGTDTRLVYIRARPALNVDISYSTNGGETWRPITRVPYQSGNEYIWEAVSLKSRRCRFTAQLKVVVKDGADKPVGSAISREFVVISNQPPRLSGNWSGYYYSAPSGTIPVSGTIDAENRYNFIGELPFGKAKFIGRFYGNCIHADDDGSLAITGDGTAYAPPGHEWSNGKSTAKIDLDAEINGAITAMKGDWTMSDNLTGYFVINRE